MLEPACRAAILTLRRKGWPTDNSGFFENVQAVDFTKAPLIPPSVRRELEAIGICVFQAYAFTRTTFLGFLPEDSGNVGAMKLQWDILADIMPDLQRVVPKSNSLQAEMFRKNPVSTAIYEISELTNGPHLLSHVTR